jgi:anti-sigma B factor antagonist
MAATNFKHISVRDVNGVAVVDFVKSPLMFEVAVVEEIGNELSRLITDHRSTKILLDFSSVQYVSSTMLAKLAALEKQMQQAKGQLKFCGLGPILMDTFRIGHFERVFSIHDDVDAAIKSFGMPRENPLEK